MKKKRSKKTATFTKPPETILIGSEIYSVQVVPELKRPEDGADAWGLCEYYTRQITLTAEMSPSKALEILLHEINHAVVFTFRDGAAEANVESFVHATNLGLVTVLMSNPKLVTWINQQIKDANELR